MWASPGRPHLAFSAQPQEVALPGGTPRGWSPSRWSPQRYLAAPTCALVPEAGALGGGRGASCARGAGAGRAAWSGPVPRASSFRAQPRRAELLPRLGLPPLPGSASLGLPPSSSSSLKRSSSSLAAWRPWRHGYARRTAAAARPSSSVPPASNWASRARTSALR